MQRSGQIGKQAASRLRGILGSVEGWEESEAQGSGNRGGELLVTCRLNGQDRAILIVPSSLGQPRQIRATVTRLREIAAARPDVTAVAAAVYIAPASARILQTHGFGYVDLSGNCRLEFGQVLVDRQGRRSSRPSARPLRSLFSPRASRVIRALLTEPERIWRLTELAETAAVSLGHAHNVARRLGDLSWMAAAEDRRLRLTSPGDLLENWAEAYSYRQNSIVSFFSPERPSRRVMADLGQAALAASCRYAFTLGAGASLVAAGGRLAGLHCYVEGDPATLAAALGWRATDEPGATIHLLAPYDAGVFHRLIEKAGLSVVSLPQLYVDLAGAEPRGRAQAEALRRDAMGY